MIILREELGIFCDVFNSILINSFDLCISDKTYLVYYFLILPFELLKNSYSFNCMTSHLKQCEVNRQLYATKNISKLVKGIR